MAETPLTMKDQRLARQHDDPPKKPGRSFPSLTPGKVLLGLVVAALFALLGFYFLPRKNLAEIARLKEQAIGLAENWESAEADVPTRGAPLAAPASGSHP